MRGLLTLVFFSLIAASCATTQNIKDLQSQITVLKDDVDILKKTSMDTKAATGANYDSVMEEVKALRGTYEEKEYQLEQQQEELAILKDAVNRNVADIETRLLALEQRLDAIEKKLAITSPSETIAPDTSPGKTAEPTASAIGQGSAWTARERKDDRRSLHDRI